jgi:hypothetical protein
MPVAWKNRDGRHHSRAERDPEREPDLRHRRRPGLRPRPRRQRQPRRLAGQGHAEHALGRVEVGAVALQMQEQAAIAERIGECARHHAGQREPRMGIEHAARVPDLHQQHAGQHHHPDREGRARDARPRIAVQQRRAQHPRHHRGLEAASHQPGRPARRGPR